MTTPATRYLIPGFSQTAGAWAAVTSGIGGAEPLDIPLEESFAATASALAEGRTGVWGGYSLGGRLALHIAVAYPSRATGLLLVSTTPGIADPILREARWEADRELAEWIGAHTVDEFLDRWLAQPLFGHRSRLHRLGTPGAIAHQLKTLSQGLQPPLWDQLRLLDMPVVVAAGAEDAKYSAIAEEMAGAIGDNASLHLIPGAGHALLEEAPETIRSLLQQLP